jgi:hypothetical protein
MEKLIEASQRMGTPEAPGTPAGSFPLSTARPRSSQAVLSEFQDAVSMAENLRRMQAGREVVGITACCVKLVNAEKQKAQHILTAADRAIAELQG